jgi:lysophospholipase L1-like esterase
LHRAALGLLSWSLAPALLVQGLWAKTRTPRLGEAAGPREGHVGEGDTLCLVALGDSIVAGVGVATTARALPAMLSAALAGRLGCKVCWYSHGHNGARTDDLLETELPQRWRAAGLLVISNGLNDVTAGSPLNHFLSAKNALYSRLRTLAPRALIAQLGIPPLGHFPALPQPLRFVLGQRAGLFDRALAALIEPTEQVIHLPFTDIPAPGLFAADGYHPGPRAVAIWAKSLAEEIAGVLCIGTDDPTMVSVEQ